MSYPLSAYLQGILTLVSHHIVYFLAHLTGRLFTDSVFFQITSTLSLSLPQSSTFFFAFLQGILKFISYIFPYFLAHITCRLSTLFLPCTFLPHSLSANSYPFTILFTGYTNIGIPRKRRFVLAIIAACRRAVPQLMVFYSSLNVVCLLLVSLSWSLTGSSFSQFLSSVA